MRTQVTLPLLVTEDIPDFLRKLREALRPLAKIRTPENKEAFSLNLRSPNNPAGSFFIGSKIEEDGYGYDAANDDSDRGLWILSVGLLIPNGEGDYDFETLHASDFKGDGQGAANIFAVFFKQFLQRYDCPGALPEKLRRALEILA